MKIVHCCLSSFYIDNYGYQENILPRQNKLDGHDVSIIASTETYINNNQLGYVEPRTYINEDGIPVTRVPYKKVLTHFISRKIRSYQAVYSYLENESPDIILFHGMSAWELLTVARYKRNHPHVRLYADSHSDFNNSAKGFISKFFLHDFFYGTIARISSRYIDKILCISLEAEDFLRKHYRIPENKLEFYPLGGLVLSDQEYENRRHKIRAKLGLNNNDILLAHAGKMDKHKRTEAILKAMAKVDSPKLKLVIIGSFTDDIKSIVEPMIWADERVSYEGWKKADELSDYLCAADIYVQPGGQSATLQNAMCRKCALMIYPHRSHEAYIKGNGYYVKTSDDMAACFKRFVDCPDSVNKMAEKSLKIAKSLLDYRLLSLRLFK